MTFSSSICLPLLISRDGNGFMSLCNTPDRSVEFCCYSISFLFFVNPGMRSEDLEQPRCALSAADAHGNDAVFGATALAFEQEMTGHARARHTVRVADGDCAARNIQPVLGDAEPVAAVDHLAGEGFVQFPYPDVGYRQPGLLQQLRHRQHRTYAHLSRIAARHRHAAVQTQWREAAPCRFVTFH